MKYKSIQMVTFITIGVLWNIPLETFELTYQDLFENDIELP